MSRLEDRAELVYRYLYHRAMTRTNMPTLLEIAAVLNLTKSQVMTTLDHLERDGRIWREPGQHRAITITALEPGAAD